MENTNTTIKEEKETKNIVFVPKVDIYSDNSNIYLLGDFPGVDESNLDISVEKDVLTISGKVKTPTVKESELKYSEYRIGDFRRTFTLNEDVDAERIEAALKNGVLRLTLPKAKPVTKKIEVKTA